MSRKSANQKRTISPAEKPLGTTLELLHRARVEAALDKIALLREQLLYIVSRAKRGDLATSTMKVLSLDLEQELTRTICDLETWHFEMGDRT
jgi:hypothetical protein